MALAIAGACGFDLRDDSDKPADFIRSGVTECGSPGEALADAEIVFSLVSADQALDAAKAAAACLRADTLWLDMNSVAPETKRSAAREIERVGGRYVDVAIMAPVLPLRFAVPLLLSGEHAANAAQVLSALGFTNVRCVAGAVGAAASIKMIRSVMIKGIEALSAECALAADAAGVLPEIIASLNESGSAPDWAARIDYNLDRMIVHGGRRAAEMGEVVLTLDTLGTGSLMSRGCQRWQAEIGEVGLRPPAGLEAKLALLGSPGVLETKAAEA